MKPVQVIFIFIIPLGKGFFCACSLIFTTSKGVTEKKKLHETLKYDSSTICQM